MSNPQTPITQQGREGTARTQSQLSQVGALGDSANAATNEALSYRKQQAALKQQADMQSRLERSNEMISQLGSWEPTNASGKRGSVINAAKRLLGIDYVYGGGHGGKIGPSYSSMAHGSKTYGIDCSGLVRYAFAKAGINAWGKNAVAATQSMYGRAASVKSLLPGDLVVRGGRGSATHIAIYLGGGRILEAQQTGTRVHIRSIGKGAGWTGIHLNY
jgi:cell wall-associated NlpC family hydrolase